MNVFLQEKKKKNHTDYSHWLNAPYWGYEIQSSVQNFELRYAFGKRPWFAVTTSNWKILSVAVISCNIFVDCETMLPKWSLLSLWGKPLD